jgi:methylenetetrahydrofolate reductase (NADPH)
VSAAGGSLAALLEAGTFVVTGEIVPPRTADGASVTAHARALVGYVDAVNVTDNPTASAHMAPSAGAAFVARAGIEPTLQLTTRDRNRLALTAELLGGWALGARNLLCLSGDPIAIGDHPDAAPAGDLDVTGLVRLARGLRDVGPAFLVGVADVPLADPYDPARLEAKVDAGAQVIWTQIAYDVAALGAWLEVMRARGILERAKILVGVAPLRSARAARAMDAKLPGVSVPASLLGRLDEAGEAGEAAAGTDITVEVVRGIRAIDGIAGVHLMGMGHDDVVRAVVEGAELFPRPTGVR